MRYSGTESDDDRAGWFRLGSVEMNTTNIVVGLWVITLLVWTAEPVSKPVTTAIALFTNDVASGEAWRLVTWPWAHEAFSLWDIIGIAIFWLFGTELERTVGRSRYTWLIGLSILIIGVVATALGTLLSQDTVIADIGLLQLTVLLLYIAEHPTRPFFFNIPAWVIGAVIVALEVVNDLAYREWVRLLTVIVAAALIALVARKIDLLTQYDKVPDLHLPRRKRKGETSAPGRRRRKGGTGGLGPVGPDGDTPAGAGSSAKRGGPLWGRKQPESEPAEIVQMPSRPRPQPVVNTSVPDVSADDLALDALLDKIADGGMDSLTPAERQNLTELTARRKKT